MKLYSAEFKAKIVIELLGCDITLNELASKYAVTPKSIQNWKKRDLPISLKNGKFFHFFSNYLHFIALFHRISASKKY